MKSQCSTCIFRQNSVVRKAGRIITEKAVKEDTVVVCHSTMLEPENAVCRGFFDAHKTGPLVLAIVTDALKFQEQPK
jgi:hypothetical protein